MKNGGETRHFCFNFVAPIMKKKVAFYTLGCKLNFAESSAIARSLEPMGFSRVEFVESPDLFVINTCSVTDHADKKCKKVVREAKKSIQRLP